jgi:SnoaL-like domain
VTAPHHDLDVRARLDIADVLVRYASGIDRCDWALFRSCFTDDCDADYDDELVRTEDGWRIRRRRFTPVLLQPVGPER